MTRTALVVVALGIAACATVTSEHVVTGAQLPAYAGSVKVVMDGSPEPTGYVEVGIVTATGSGDGASLPSVLGALQREAAGLGRDAVIRVRYDRGTTTATATGVGVRLK